MKGREMGGMGGEPAPMQKGSHHARKSHTQARRVEAAGCFAAYAEMAF